MCGGVNIFTGQVFAPDSLVVKAKKLLRSHRGFLIVSMYHPREKNKENGFCRTIRNKVNHQLSHGGLSEQHSSGTNPQMEDISQCCLFFITRINTLFGVLTFVKYLSVNIITGIIIPTDSAEDVSLAKRLHQCTVKPVARTTKR